MSLQHKPQDHLNSPTHVEYTPADAPLAIFILLGNSKEQFIVG